MQIDGWIAIGKCGLILGSFREDKAGAELAAKQILRIIGGPPLLVGFQIVAATLVIRQEPAAAPEPVPE